MIIRKAFIANSSSSSFVCNVCGETESGFDESAEGLGMIYCENDHCLHLECCEFGDVTEEEYKKDDETIFSSYCPICTMKEIDFGDLNRYLRKLHGKTYKQIEQEIKDRFPTYNKFMEFLGT
jgi:hypothetical protein